MALFENFPYTNLHELNLDWLIQEMENLKELVQDGPVVSVNGQTGVVTLYQEAQVQLPDITDSQQTYWNIFRYLNGHIYGIRFDSNGNVYAIRDGVKTKLLTWADIPADAGVISVNGLYGVVHISGTDIPWMGGENETVFDKLSENEDAIAELNIVLGTLTNAIKAGIAYLEPNVDDTAIHNIPAGKYVFWKNYAYKSTQAISIGDTLSSTNLQAVGEGGFINDLQTQLNTLNSKMARIGNGIIKVKTVANIPIKIPCESGFGEFIILGFAQNEGCVYIRCHVSNFNVYLYKLSDNTTYSGNISVSYSTNEISITDSVGNSYLVIVGTGANN